MKLSMPAEEIIMKTPTDSITETQERSPLSTPFATPDSSTPTSLETSPEKDREVITTKSGRQVKPKKKCLCKEC